MKAKAKKDRPWKVVQVRELIGTLTINRGRLGPYAYMHYEINEERKVGTKIEFRRRVVRGASIRSTDEDLPNGFYNLLAAAVELVEAINRECMFRDKKGGQFPKVGSQRAESW